MYKVIKQLKISTITLLLFVFFQKGLVAASLEVKNPLAIDSIPQLIDRFSSLILPMVVIFTFVSIILTAGFGLLSSNYSPESKKKFYLTIGFKIALLGVALFGSILIALVLAVLGVPANLIT